MPKPVDKDDKTWPYTFHGIDLLSSGTNENVGQCPLCGQEGKFSLNGSTGQWRCFMCQETGNLQSFIQKFWTSCSMHTEERYYREQCRERGLLSPKSLQSWGLCLSTTTGRWLAPGYRVNGNIGTLYHYTRVKRRDVFRNAFLPTPTLGHYLFGVPLYESRWSTVFLCEGVWDGIALWEVVGTKNNVLATPGCGIFEEIWLQLFANKRVCLMFDNDHPYQHPKTGEMMPPPGLEGMKRVASILLSSPSPPEEVSYLKWGELGYNEALPDGHDVRDFLRTV